MAKISFRARTTIKALGHSTAKRVVETLASHGVSSEAHPNLARKGDGFGDTTRPLSIMQAHRNNKFAHAGHYVRSSEVLDSIDEYIRARDMNYATLVNALAENPQQHIVTAWILNQVIGDLYTYIDKKIDKVFDAVPGNFALWGINGTLVDGKCKPADFALTGHGHGQIANNGDVTMRAEADIQDVDPVNVKYLNDYYARHFPHSHGQISWEGVVSMRENPLDSDPASVGWVNTTWWDSIRSKAVAFLNTFTVSGKITGNGGLEIKNDQSAQLGETTIGKTNDKKNLKVNGNSSVTGNSEIGGNVSVTGNITSNAAIDDAKNDTTVPTTSWVRTRISAWWESICKNAIAFTSTLSVGGVITATAGIVAKNVCVTDIKNAHALCTDDTGNIKEKPVDTTPTENSSNLITSGGVFSWVKSYVSNWWSSICNAAVTFKNTLTVEKLLTASAGLNTKSVAISDVKSANALCTNEDGTVQNKPVDTTATKDSTNLITSDAVYTGLKSHTHGQISNSGAVTMKDAPSDTDPVNVKHLKDQISSSEKTHSHGNISNGGSVTMSDKPAETDPVNVKWVTDKITSWWSNVCTNVATTVKKLWTFDGGISSNGITDTSLTNKAVIGTNSSGKLEAKVVDTTPSSGSSRLVTSGGVADALAGKSQTNHSHGQIANNGDVTMRDDESKIQDHDPVNVEYLRDQIRNSGGITWEDWTIDLSEHEAGKIVLVDDGRINMHEGAYSVILQAVFMIDNKEFTIDIHEPVAEVKGAIHEDLPIYVPGKSLLLISDKELKFRVPDSWIEHYGTFTQEGHKFSMDPNCEEVGVIPISSYRVIVRRMSIKFDS